MENTVRFKKNDAVFLYTCLILLFLLVIFLFVDICRKSDIQADDQGTIGRILFLSNDAWRRLTAKGPRESLQRGSHIFINDIILTGPDSTASILMNDGTMVDLCEDSSGTFDRTDEGIIFTLEKGCGDFRRSGRAANEKRMVIVASGNRIAVEEGELSLVNTPGLPPELFVRSGGAEVLFKNGEETVDENERAVLKGDSVSIEKKNLVLARPADNGRYFITGDSAEVSFAWKYLESGADDEPFIFELARSPDFSRSYRRTSTADTRISVQMPSGDFFWRVSRKDPGPGRLDRSEARSLSVVRDNPLVLLNPSDGEVMEFAGEPPSIGFGWEGQRYADAYLLEISDRSDFSEILESVDLRVVNYTHRGEWDIDAGSVKTYYWRVTASNRALNWPGRTSSASHFYMKRVDRISKPVLVSPMDRKKIIRPRAASENIIFSWEMTGEHLKKRVLFSKDRNFKELYREVEPEQDHWIMKSTFPEGNYFWRVALYDDDNRGVYSGTRSFSVQELEDILLLSPDDGSELVIGDVGHRGILFKWQKPETDGTCMVELSNSRDFKRISKSVRTSSNTITMDDLPPGIFFWRVKMQDDREKVLAGSDIRAFAIKGGLATPVVISPRMGGAVTMLTENELSFLWRPTPHADAYQLELHQKIKDGLKTTDKLVLKTQTSDFKYTVTDLDLLDVGNFYWTLRAIKKDRRGRVVRFSETVKNNFNINLGESNIIIVSPEIQVIEDNKTK